MPHAPTVLGRVRGDVVQIRATAVEADRQGARTRSDGPDGAVRSGRVRIERVHGMVATLREEAQGEQDRLALVPDLVVNVTAGVCQR